MAQQVWRGSITLRVGERGRAGPSRATRDHKVHFHQIDSRSGSRIGYDKVAKSTGEKVDKDDIALGYEVEPGSLRHLRPRGDRRAPTHVDPHGRDLGLRRPGSDRSRLLREDLLARALGRGCREGLLVAGRGDGGRAAGRDRHGRDAHPSSTWPRSARCRARWPCRPCASPTRWWRVADVSGMPERVEPSDKELELAKQIISGLEGEWDPEQYRDSYTEELRSIIARRPPATS